ncbi:MAG: hypothetical protein LQ340_006583 [Diploschistes diacapsis]|nr:MAG: hypothetical protein LQ340_006583 [Diploschistes diacapsis]
MRFFPIAGVFASILLTISASPLGTSQRDDATTDATTAISSSTVIQTSNGTWLENIARTSTGGILLSELNPSPALLYVANPTGPSPSAATIHTFDAPATGVAGIGQLGTDVFYVATLNYSFTTFSPVPETAQLWKVDLSESTSNPPTTLVASLPQIQFINGVTGVPGTTKVLIADYGAGEVYRLDVETGSADVALNSPAVNVPSGATGGVNGVHAPGDGYLYFSNSGLSTIGKVAIDSTTALPTGNPRQLWTNTTVTPDDFALLPSSGSPSGAVVADSANNRVVNVRFSGSNSFTTLANIGGPTSGVFADATTLFVASSGGDNLYAQDPIPVGGALTEITLS